MSNFRTEATPKTTGFPELDAKLKYMATSAANVIVSRAVRVGLYEGAKWIRRRIAPTLQAGLSASDKGIGTSTSRKKSNGASGKVGVAVGAASKNAKKLTRGSFVRRGKRKGEGISANNLRWFAMGTQDRWTGSKRVRAKGAKPGARQSTGKRVRFVGKIDRLKWGGFVQEGMAAANAAIQEKMRANVQKNLTIAATKGTAGAFEGMTNGN